MKTIPLTQGYEAIVDDEDYESLSKFRWTAVIDSSGYIYAVCQKINGEQTWLLMHRFLLNPDNDLYVNHKDDNGLNNQRSNLRICTLQQCRQNSKPKRGRKYKGTYLKKNGAYQVMINGKHIGMYSTEEEGAKAYDEVAKRLHGEFAKLNFPQAIN